MGSYAQYFQNRWLTFLYSFFDFLYSNNKKVDNDADIEANNVSEENAIIIDFSYVCDMDYTAAKVRVRVDMVGTNHNKVLTL